MGTFAGIVRGSLAGLNEAAGNPGTAQALQQKNQQAEQAHLAQVRAQIMPHSFAIKGLQAKLQSLDQKTNPEEYAAVTHDIARNLAEVRGIIYPDKNPQGNFFERGITDKLHLSSLKARQDKLKQQQAAAGQEGKPGDETQAKDRSGAQAIAQGTVPPVNPYTQEASQLKEAGFGTDQVQKALEHKAGIIPKLTSDGIPYKGTDGKYYQNFKDESGAITPREMPPTY